MPPERTLSPPPRQAAILASSLAGSLAADSRARVAGLHGQLDVAGQAGALMHEMVQQVLAFAHLERVQVDGRRVQRVLDGRHHLRR